MSNRKPDEIKKPGLVGALIWPTFTEEPFPERIWTGGTNRGVLLNRGQVPDGVTAGR
jgi:hypothetical protein